MQPNTGILDAGVDVIANGVSLIAVNKQLQALEQIVTDLIQNVPLTYNQSALLQGLANTLKLDSSGRIIASESISPQTINGTLLGSGIISPENISSSAVNSFHISPTTSLGNTNSGDGISVLVPTGSSSYTDMIQNDVYTTIDTYVPGQKLLVGGTVYSSSGAAPGTAMDLSFTLNISLDGFTLSGTYQPDFLPSGHATIDINGNAVFTVIGVVPDSIGNSIMGAVTLLGLQISGGPLTFDSTTITVINLN
jgi:hypothetical protein